MTSGSDRLMDHWGQESVERAQQASAKGNTMPDDGAVYLVLVIAASAAVTTLASVIYVGQTLWRAGKAVSAHARRY